MILSPLQNQEVTVSDQQVQDKPFITQDFGENPSFYKQFGHEGHNGIDFRAPVGTLLFAPIEGTVVTGNQGNQGYGKYIEIAKHNLRVILAHLNEFLVEDGEDVFMGDLVALTGNTGLSTGPHLHMTVKFRDEEGNTRYQNNGFNGAVDFGELLITWRGTLRQPVIT